MAATYLIVATVAGLWLSQKNLAELRDLRKTFEYTLFAKHQQIIALLVGDRQAASDIYSSDIEQFASDVRRNSDFVSYAEIVDLLLRKRSFANLMSTRRLAELAADPNIRSEIAGEKSSTRPISNRALAITAVMLAQERLSSFILVGDIAKTFLPLLLLLTILLAFYFAFQVQSVFHTRQLIAVYPHPKFSILCFQFSFVLFAPCLLLACVEASYWPDYLEAASHFFRGIPQVTWEDAQRFRLESEHFLPVKPISFIDMLGRWNNGDTADVYRPILASVLFALAAVMSGAIWIARRFGWGVFLAGLLGWAILFFSLVVLINTRYLTFTLGDISMGDGFMVLGMRSDPEIFSFLISSLVAFLALFMAGKSVRSPLRPYLISTGYSGALFSMSLLSIFVGVPRTFGLSAIVLSLAIAFIAVSILELAMRRLLYNLLYNPQP